MDLKRLNISERTLAALNKKHLFTVRDFLEFFPRKAIRYGKPLDIQQANGSCAIIGKQVSVQKKRMVTGKTYLVFYFKGSMDYKVVLFNNVFLLNMYASFSGKDVVVCGEPKYDEYGYSIVDVTGIYLVSQYQPHTHTVYPSLKDADEKEIAKIRENFMLMQQEIVEPHLIAGFMPYKQALQVLHDPQNKKIEEEAKRRILFNDLLYFNLSLKRNRVETPKNTSLKYKSWSLTQSFIKSLPFALTQGQGGQAAILNEIFLNARNGIRNNILLQGDVGCGKTIVAAAMMFYSAENGYQSVLMAPKEILARQHYEEISEYAKCFGLNCVFLHSKLLKKERNEILKRIQSGEIHFIVGTHSCISSDVVYHNLGSVITDEEHLFGVEQKEALIKKANDGVHSISMSATPIPRTMANVLYGQGKEIKLITQKPAGRLPIITKVSDEHNEVFNLILEQIQAGHQCYVVCPAIEDNDNTDIVSIEQMSKLYRDFFTPRGIGVGVVNGKMKSTDVAKTISAFANNNDHTCDILISTTVIEVGVNVPSATVMVIEQANRFGLATLHQLRGRVGRSSYQSYCYMIAEDVTNERLQTMVSTNDGFKIAEADLHQRGTGDLIGQSQSGINKYVEEMLDNPELFKQAELLAKECIRNNIGNFLIAEYKEHEELEELYKNKKKKKKEETNK